MWENDCLSIDRRGEKERARGWAKENQYKNVCGCVCVSEKKMIEARYVSVCVCVCA
jgi:hypothetical protein